MRGTSIRVAGFLVLLALLALVVVPASAEAAPALTVSPASGPPGTSFVVTGTGFAPGSTVLFGAVDQATEPVAAELLQIAADGSFRTVIDSTGFALGEYTVVVGTSDASTLLANGTFTVTAGGAGGGGAAGGGAASGGTGGPTTMPRSGGGGMTPDAGMARLLPAGLTIVAFAAFGAFAAVAARRRRAH
jgi:hypothetical protein